MLHVAYAATTISSFGRKATTLASVAEFAPPWLVDCIQSCRRAEAQVSILEIAPIDGHTSLVLVAQGLQLCLPGTLFRQRWQVLAAVFSGFCSVQAPSCAQVSIAPCKASRWSDLQSMNRERSRPHISINCKQQHARAPAAATAARPLHSREGRGKTYSSIRFLATVACTQTRTPDTRKHAW